MPKTSILKENTLRRAIRSELAKDPLISTNSLQFILDKGGYHISEQYLLKLIHKVTGEIEYEVDNVDLKARLTSTRERTILIINRLMKIAFWEFEYLKQGIMMPNLDQQINAMQTIINMDLALLRAELIGGIYKGKPGGAEDVQQLLADPIVKVQIIGALRAWRVTPSNAAQTEAAQ